METFKERRRFTRVPVFTKVKTTMNDINYSFSYAKNISLDGMALENKVILDNKHSIAIDDILSIKFKLPMGRFYIKTDAKIIRIDGDMIAVKFLEVEDQYKDDIKSYVNNYK